MTAIAAVIALSSTPLLAQAADTGAAQSAPVVVAPPAPTAEPAAPAASAQTASPDVAAPAPAEVQPAPQPAMKTMSTPVEHSADATSASSVTSGAGTAAPARRAAAVPAAASHLQARTSTTAEAPAAVSHMGPVARTAAPATSDTSSPPAAAPDSAAPAPAPAATVSTTRSTTTHDETLPIAIGLGVIAIGGVAFALSRRKRDDDADELLLETPVESAPVVAAEPATMAPRIAEPAPMAVAPATVAAAEGPSRLPNGFDLSRFGRHTRAAYLGPTPDNPSHSLKRRLKRASFFDQREREAAAAMREPVYPESRAAQAATTDQVTIRMAPGRKPSNFGYVPQR
jgi:hypothetical protein